MPLRPYQQDFVDSSMRHFEEGITAQLGVLPTAAGKTVVATEIAKRMRPRGRILFLVHLDELCFQSRDKFLEAGFRVGLEKAKYETAPSRCDVVVASVQTLGTGAAARLLKFVPQDFSTVIIDETHHGVKGKHYHKILDHMRVLKCGRIDPDRLVLGITATPNRSDNEGLEKLFQKIIYEKSIRDLMTTGITGPNGKLYPYLADLIGYRAETNVDVSSVDVRQGDFVAGQLAKVINTPARNRMVIDNYLKYGEGKPFIAFTVDIQHSEDLARTACEMGVYALPISGNTPAQDRRRMIDRYREGEIRGLCSCGVISEGFDAPIATVGLMCRPTKSQLLYTQQAGRILRPYPSPEEAAAANGSLVRWKDHAILIDFADNAGKHSLVGIPTLFGIRSKFNFRGKSVVKTLGEIEAVQAKNLSLDLSGCESIEDVHSTVSRIDLFRPPVVPPFIRKISDYCWVQESPDSFRLALDRSTLRIRVNHLNQFEISKSQYGVTTILGTRTTPLEALELADSQVPKGRPNFAHSNARWMKDPPSESQSHLLYSKDPAIRGRFSSKHLFFVHCEQEYLKGNQGYTKGGLSKRLEVFTCSR